MGGKAASGGLASDFRFKMLICCLKLNSVLYSLWQRTSDLSVLLSSRTCSATVAVCEAFFVLKADQKLFIRLCVYMCVCVLWHHCADSIFIFVCVLTCMFVSAFAHTHTQAFLSVTTGFNHL